MAAKPRRGSAWSMKLFSIVILCGLLSGRLLAADSFWQQLSAEERQAAGLAQLTPEQQASLDQLAARFAREGSRVEVEKVRAETKAEVEKQVAKRKVERAGLEKDEDEVVKSRIVGKFNGWSGRTLFRLENGQQWVQSDASEKLWLPESAGPEVEIRASGFGGWKLSLPGGRWVRVKRVN